MATTFPITKRLLLAGVAISLTAVSVVVGIAVRSNSATGVGTSHLWPPFTMTYTYQAFDATGRPTVDQTHLATVLSEHEWRDEVTSDTLDRAQVGSYREFASGVLVSFDAKLGVSRTFTNEADSLVSINSFLNPRLFVDIRNGKVGSGWVVATAGPGKLANAKQETRAQCPSPSGLRDCTEQLRVDWAAAGFVPGFQGRIPQSGERTVEGQVIERFTVIGLKVQ
jgi:hypothetical protein